ncbi:acyltransferase family protein [Glaciecola sp. KUL10]|uniref:acyltransferase family protein n=1 Tax=Glaciecola sp. (strain KUL10) TaxID=2161813 RepID=UPI000D7821E8|nr:acyltransferase family protein [Glaciecola sp. KUL10]GBL04852.1 acyltransferase 3 [Glaciecola sp. KUL10]
MGFRQDINGLRAIAVLAVVLFHFNAAWLPGGFVGVDIFFVISGFLMTGIIFKGIENEDFSLATFYLARANRIIPALAILCIFMTIFGWFMLVPLEYEKLATHVISSLAFVSNIVYWKESGYFDVASNEKWLLHTWSLSVEWQFYIIYPIVLLFLKKFMTLNSLKVILIIGVFLGFLLSLLATPIWPNPAYFLLPTRAWEMMLGGVAFLFPLRATLTVRKFINMLGILLIVLSVLFIHEEDLWPGYLAAVPTFGTYLIIQANLQSSIFTNNLAFRYLGKWSYSIYLWHWPIAVFIYSYSLGLVFSMLGVAISVLAGMISFQYVEQMKFRKTWGSGISVINHKPILFAAIASVFGLVVYVSEGVDSSVREVTNSEQAKYMAKYHRSNYKKYLDSAYSQQCNYFDAEAFVAKSEEIASECIQTGKGGIFIWGDSHAQSISYGVRQTFTKQPISQIASSACRPLVKEDDVSTGQFKIACDRANKRVLKALLEVNPKIVLLAQQTDHDKNNFIDIVDYLRKNKLNSHVVLVGPVPQWKPSLPSAIAKRHFDSTTVRFDDPSFVSRILDIDEKLKEKYEGSSINYISVTDGLCNKEGCLAKVDDENTPVVWDYGHLSLEGSIMVSQTILKPYIDKFFLEEAGTVISAH